MPATEAGATPRDPSGSAAAETPDASSGFDAAPDPLCVLDRAGRVRRCNAAFRDAAGVDRGDPVGMAVADLVHSDDRIAWRRAARRVRRGEAVRDLVLRATGRDRVPRWWWWHVGSPTPAGWIHLAGRDVTTWLGGLDRTGGLLLHPADREAAMRELEAFALTVAHDLRTPLRSIAGYATLLGEEYGDRLDVRGARLLDRITEHVGRMTELIGAFLSLSRFGRTVVRREPVDPGRLVSAVVDELRPSLDPAVEIRVAELPPCRADAPLVKQVFANLIANAVKFRARGRPPVVEVRAETTRHGTAFVVSDNGVGFEPAHARRLFRVFQRLHSPEDYPGHGIGLAVVQRIVARHGGRVWVRAAPGRGASFYFTLEPGGGSEPGGPAPSGRAARSDT